MRPGLMPLETAGLLGSRRREVHGRPDAKGRVLRCFDAFKPANAGQLPADCWRSCAMTRRRPPHMTCGSPGSRFETAPGLIPGSASRFSSTIMDPDLKERTHGVLGRGVRRFQDRPVQDRGHRVLPKGDVGALATVNAVVWSAADNAAVTIAVASDREHNGHRGAGHGKQSFAVKPAKGLQRFAFRCGRSTVKHRACRSP